MIEDHVLDVTPYTRKARAVGCPEFAVVVGYSVARTGRVDLEHIKNLFDGMLTKEQVAYRYNEMIKSRGALLRIAKLENGRML
jgi:hypothetical protein